jgi:hypothetical protein
MSSEPSAKSYTHRTSVIAATSEIRVRQETTSATAADHHHVKRQGDDGLDRRAATVGLLASQWQKHSFCQ